jgi:hypothetical protein
MIFARQKGGAKVIKTADAATNLLHGNLLKSMVDSLLQVQAMAHIFKGKEGNGASFDEANDFLVQEFSAGMPPIFVGVVLVYCGHLGHLLRKYSTDFLTDFAD